ncbi:hypothetical protein [Sphingosinicella sp. BN140058]|nr:hypothetical protein [Sphingosinicella sp. BN140058]
MRARETFCAAGVMFAGGVIFLVGLVVMTAAGAAALISKLLEGRP